MLYENRIKTFWHELFMKTKEDYDFLISEREELGEISFSKFYNRYRELGPYSEEEFKFRAVFLTKLVETMRNEKTLDGLEEFHDKDSMYKLLNRLELENSRYRYYIDKKNFSGLSEEQKEILNLELERVKVAVDSLGQMRNWLIYGFK